MKSLPTRLALIGLGLILALPASSTNPAQAATQSYLFESLDAFALSEASDVQISRDGKRIAYVRRSQDIMTDAERSEIWLIDVSSGQQTPLGAPGSSRPRWSPDGQRLAYVAKGAADKQQIWVHWLATGTSTAITALPESPSTIAWAPDGHTVAFCMFVPEAAQTLGTPAQKPDGAGWAEAIKVDTKVHFRADERGNLRAGYNHIFIVPADGGASRQLTFGAYDDASEINWMPDGQHLLISSDRNQDRELSPLNSDVFSVDVRSGAFTQLTKRVGPDEQPIASPDGKLIAYVGFDDKVLGYQNRVLYVMNAGGKDSRAVSGRFDRTVGDPAWAADGRSIYVDYTDHAVSYVARFGLDGKMTTVAAGLAGGDLDRPYADGGGFSVAKDGTIAFPWGDAQMPPEVGVAAHGRRRKLTALNADLFEARRLGAVTPFTVRSSVDGLPVEAWMVTPPDIDPAKKYPMILEIHGGPYGSYGPFWATAYQLPGAGHELADHPSHVVAEAEAILAWFGRYRTDSVSAQTRPN